MSNLISFKSDYQPQSPFGHACYHLNSFPSGQLMPTFFFRKIKTLPPPTCNVPAHDTQKWTKVKHECFALSICGSCQLFVMSWGRHVWQIVDKFRMEWKFVSILLWLFIVVYLKFVMYATNVWEFENLFMLKWIFYFCRIYSPKVI